jgi:hypothetical protein
MKRIAGIISFLGAGTYLIFLIYAFFEEELYQERAQVILLFTASSILCLCVLYYCFSNKFWISRNPILDSLEMETEIIKKKIEKKELLLKLEKLEQQ